MAFRYTTKNLTKSRYDITAREQPGKTWIRIGAWALGAVSVMALFVLFAMERSANSPEMGRLRQENTQLQQEIERLQLDKQHMIAATEELNRQLAAQSVQIGKLQNDLTFVRSRK